MALTAGLVPEGYAAQLNRRFGLLADLARRDDPARF